MSDYPVDRKNCGFAIRYARALLNSDAIRTVGRDPVLLAVFVAMREDQLHYSKAPRFWRLELMERFAIKSPKDFVRIRDAAVNAGFLHCDPSPQGNRTLPTAYWAVIPDWLESLIHPFPKGNESSATRSRKGTSKGTCEGTGKGTLSIPCTLNPIDSVRSTKKPRTKFQIPDLKEIRAYCQERKNSVDPEGFRDHYQSNGWKVGRNAMKDWKAAVRKWEKNDFSKNGKAEQPTGRPTR